MLKILDFRALFPEKLVFEIFGVNIQNFWKSEIAILWRIQFPLFWHILFEICFSIHWSSIDIADDHL